MKMLLPLLFLLPTLGLAQKPDLIDCPPEPNTANAIMEKLQGNGCESDSVAISNLVNSEYGKFYGKEPQIKQKVKNVLLSGSKKELELANQMLGARPPKEWNQAVKDCSTILCALGKLFGSEEAAKQALNIHAKTGYIASIDQSINGNLGEHVWSPKEILEIDAALSKIPDPIKKLPKLKKIYRQANGIRLKEHGSSVAAFAANGDDTASGMIVIYDNGMSALSTNKNPYHSSAFTQEALVHEICHHHDFQTLYATNFTVNHSQNKKNGWMKISGWKKTYDRQGKENWSHDPNAAFTRDYAATDPGEDYAETCMNYVLHADRLKKLSPEKYTYMKDKVFKGEEFRDKSWNEEREYDWPEMDKFAQDESFCEEAFQPCIDKAYASSDNICVPYSVVTQGKVTTTQSHCGPGNNILRQSLCLNELRQKKILEANQKFSQDSRYCEAGGPSFILTKLETLCANTTDKLGKILDQVNALEFVNQAQVCEQNKDYTRECVYQKAMTSLTFPKMMEKGITQALFDKVPDRIEPLSKHIDSTPSSVWLRGCFKGIEGIQKTKTGTLAYSNSRDNFIYAIVDQEKNSSLIDCAFGAVDSFKGLGFKTPPRGVIEKMMTENFQKELSSFENEVIWEYPKAAEPCIADFCRADILRKLLKKWEEKEPVKRKGFSNKEVVDELFPKIKDF